MMADKKYGVNDLDIQSFYSSKEGGYSEYNEFPSQENKEFWGSIMNYLGPIGNRLTADQASSAAEYNQKHAQRVGWKTYYNSIVHNILKLRNDPDPLTFAQAVANWQAENGFSGRSIDGKLGPGSWSKMKQQLSTNNQNNTSPSGIDRIPASRLSWSRSDPYPRRFKERVYNKAIERAKRVRQFTPTLPSNLVVEIEGKPLRRDAAKALQSLLTKLRSDIHTQKKDLQVKIASGYRSANTQFNLWNGRFRKYYERAIKGGVIKPNDYSPKAETALARYIGGKTAAPGYSKHQRGVAVDFIIKNSMGRPITSISTTRAAINRWKQNWVWHWLNRHASKFNFYPYTKEPWQWEYKT